MFSFQFGFPLHYCSGCVDRSGVGRGLTDGITFIVLAVSHVCLFVDLAPRSVPARVHVLLVVVLLEE